MSMCDISKCFVSSYFTVCYLQTESHGHNLCPLISHIVILNIEPRGHHVDIVLGQYLTSDGCCSHDVDIDLGQYLTSDGCSFPAPLPPYTTLSVNMSSILIFVPFFVLRLRAINVVFGGEWGGAYCLKLVLTRVGAHAISNTSMPCDFKHNHGARVESCLARLAMR